jgi:methionyl-tRNA formyltransferase
MRIVFMGSPEFALPALSRLIESEHEIVGVYTQPDRPSGRGRKLTPPPVKTLALAHGLDVRQPKSISKPDVVEDLRRLAPDVGVIAAYGQILRQPVLDVPPLGIVNIHASLLPRWRGAAPIPASILAGDAETGATIMLVRLALDAGPMLGAARVPISASDTTATLTPKVANAGASLLMEVLPGWARHEIAAVEQDESLATYAPQIEKADALIDWDRQTVREVLRSVRAYNPWPTAFSYMEGQPLRLLECAPLVVLADRPPGTIFSLEAEASPPGAGFAIAAVDGAVAAITVQGPGGKPMAASAYLRGHTDIIGKQLRRARS